MSKVVSVKSPDLCLVVVSPGFQRELFAKRIQRNFEFGEKLKKRSDGLKMCGQLGVNKKTNRMLRTHLVIRRAKKGDLSKFVDKAVRQTLFRETAASVKDRNADADSDVIEAAIDEAIKWSRETRS